MSTTEIEEAAKRGAKAGVEEALSESSTNCGICTSDPKEIEEHHKDRRWVRFWRGVTEKTSFKLAQLFLLVLMILAFGLLIKSGSLLK